MLVAEAINTDTRVLTSIDTLAKALEQMDNLQVDTLPIINETTRKLDGQITRSVVESVDESKRDDALISQYGLEEPIMIFNNQHLFHAVQILLQHEVRVLPVVDREHVFQGLIEKHQVLESLGKMLNLTEYGSVITVELAQQDFTLSEIVQLIETEGGKILGITVEPPTAERKTYEVSIKLNLQDVSRVASALRRYDYSVLTESKSESANIDLETRADEFLKFLDI